MSTKILYRNKDMYERATISFSRRVCVCWAGEGRGVIEPGFPGIEGNIMHPFLADYIKVSTEYSSVIIYMNNIFELMLQMGKYVFFDLKELWIYISLK